MMGRETFFLTRLNGMTPPKRGNRARRRIPGFLGCCPPRNLLILPNLERTLEKAAECKTEKVEHLSRQILEFRCSVLKNDDKDLNF